MRQALGWMVALGVILLIVGSVAAFKIPTLEVLAHGPMSQEPLSHDELYRLGALKAMYSYCNWPVEETIKATDLSRRIGFNPAQGDALMKAKDGFKDANCDKLRFQFPDMYRWVKW